MHQNTRKLSFFAIFKLMTHIFPIFLLISGSKIAAQEIRIGSGVNFKTDHFSLILPEGFDQRKIDTAGVILSVRYRNSFPTLNIVEAPGSSQYPSHLKVEQRVLESYRAVGIQHPSLIGVERLRFGSFDLSEPLVVLGYELNDERLKAEVGFINLKNSYLTITLVERSPATYEESKASELLRSNLRWIGGPKITNEVNVSKSPSVSSSSSLNVLNKLTKQILGLVGIILGVFILVKAKNLIWRTLFK